MKKKKPTVFANLRAYFRFKNSLRAYSNYTSRCLVAIARRQKAIGKRAACRTKKAFETLVAAGRSNARLRLASSGVGRAQTAASSGEAFVQAESVNNRGVRLCTFSELVERQLRVVVL